MSQAARVLVVEDDEQMRGLLAALLTDGGFLVSTAASADEAIAAIEADDVDVVLSDIKLRDRNGMDVLTAARARPLPPEVVMLTGYASVETSVAALRGDAYDYLLKPVKADELITVVGGAAGERLARARRAEALRVLLEGLELPARPAPAANEPAPPDEQAGRYHRVGRLHVDTHRRAVLFAGADLHVTPTEYELLRCLAAAPGRVLTCEEIVRHTHGHSASAADAQTLLRGHVRNLRRKIPDGYLVTARGSGYMLVQPGPGGEA